MYNRSGFIITVVTLVFTSTAFAQDDGTSDADELKIAALEALMAAPPERALPLVTKVLQGDNSDEVKESALFILSQIEIPEAQALLLETARQSDGELQEEAIQMIGVGGDANSLAGLRDIYASGDSEVREAVLEAYMIADDSDSIYELAVAADNEDDFEAAVELLGAMGANDDLRKLLERGDVSESLIDAYAIAGDFETLRELAMDNSNPDSQAQAIEALGIVGGDQANATLLQIYKGAESAEVKEAALDGMHLSDYDQGVLELYRESQDPREKRELLEYLTMMDSDEIWDLIDEALENRR